MSQEGISLRDDTLLLGSCRILISKYFQLDPADLLRYQQTEVQKGEALNLRTGEMKESAEDPAFTYLAFYGLTDVETEAKSCDFQGPSPRRAGVEPSNSRFQDADSPEIKP